MGKGVGQDRCAKMDSDGTQWKKCKDYSLYKKSSFLLKLNVCFKQRDLEMILICSFTE